MIKLPGIIPAKDAFMYTITLGIVQWLVRQILVPDIKALKATANGDKWL